MQIRKLTRRQLLRVGAGSGLALGLLGLAACQQAPAPASTPAADAKSDAQAPATAAAQSPSQAQVAEIRFMAGGEDAKGAEAIYAAKFHPEHPNIRVTVQPSPEGRDEKLIASMVAGNAPDVFLSWRDNVTQFADRGQVLDLEPYVRRDLREEDLSDFYEWQWQGFVLPNGMRYGMPWYVNMMLLRYNKDMFEQHGIKPPDDTWTHDTYAEAAIKLTSWKDNRAETLGLYYPVWSWDRYWYKIEAWGGHVVDPNDDTKAAFDSDVALEALEWSRKLMWDDRAMAERLLTSTQGSDATTLFATGRLGMIEDGSTPRSMAVNVQDKVRWAYAHTPPGPVRRKVLGTSDGFVAWKGTKFPDAAWEVLKFNSGTDYQINQAKFTTRFPARYSALQEWKRICIEQFPVLESANLDAAIEAMDMGYPGHREIFKKDAEARQIIVPALEKVYVTGGTPVTYFKEVAQEVTKKMRE